MILLVITDGRDHIFDTIDSARANLLGEFSHWVIYDDSGDEPHRDALASTFPSWVILGHERQGFGGAIQAAWKYLETRDEDFVFHLEDDFTFNRPVNLEDMSAVLDANPHLAQMALRRQAWNASELKAGGVVELHPDDYEDCYDGLDHWLEHRLFFTTTPSLYRRSLVVKGWPDGPESEGRFSAELFMDPNVKCGYWGSRDSGEWVTHNGEKRTGFGY